MRDVVVTTAIRTPVGRAHKGKLKDTRPDDLAAVVIRAALERTPGLDPDRIDAGRKEFVRDLPGGAGRYKAWPVGVQATIVNGVPVIVDNEPTGAKPGMVVRPNRI